jgi:hypothetical protein
LVGKPEGKRPLGRPKCERIILKMILEKWGEKWIDSARDKDQWNGLLDVVTQVLVL